MLWETGTLKSNFFGCPGGQKRGQPCPRRDGDKRKAAGEMISEAGKRGLALVGCTVLISAVSFSC